MSLTMKLPTVPFIASVLELPGVASAFANKNCPCTRKTAEKKKKKKNPGIILSIHYRVFIGIDLVPGKIRPYKKLSLLLNYAPGQTFCESMSFKGDSGDKFVSL